MALAPPDPIPEDVGAPAYGLPWVPDIDFAEKDPAVIANEVVLDYEAAFKTLTNIAKTLAPGDPVRLFLLVVCHWLSHQRVLIDFTGKQNLLKYAHDDYLDNLAALYGTRALRQQASPAMTTLRFTIVAPLISSVTIPKGTYCQAPNAVVFQTLVDGVIPGGEDSVDVLAAALVPGTIGNGFALGQINSIINWNQAFGVEVTNVTVSSGGADAETDEQYRYRIWLAIESFSTCGPRDAYEFWALSADPAIIQCVVHSAPEIAGEVWLYPLLRNGQIPSQEIRDKVLAKCSASTVRPVTDYVQVFAPDQFVYSLNMNYWVLKSNEVLLATIQANVAQAVADWILWERSYVSRDIIGDELRKRCLQAGAKRIEIVSPSPAFQSMAFNQLAVHSVTPAPIINFVDLEDA